MNSVQYFLGKAMEEASELIQILAKTQAFGADEFYAKDPDKRSNIQRVNDEFNDLLATIERLNYELIRTRFMNGGALFTIPALTPIYT